MPSDKWLTSRQVAERLGVHPATVHRISRDELPYDETTGGATRAGWRRYLPEDVETYRSRRSGGAGRVAALEREVHELRDRSALVEQALIAERVERSRQAERLEIVEKQLLDMAERLERAAQHRELT